MAKTIRISGRPVRAIEEYQRIRSHARKDSAAASTPMERHYERGRRYRPA
jgi:hypothetical protein